MIFPSLTSRARSLALSLSRSLSLSLALSTHTHTPGGGASLGPEGPAVDVGLSVARGTAAAFFPKSRARVAEPLLAAGAGAGVAAGFGAPLSGAFFAVETVLLRRWSGGRPGPSDATTGLAVSAVLLAAVLAALASSSGLGGLIGLGPPRVAVPPYALPSAAELPLALGLGALCGGVARGARRAERAAAAAALAAEEEGGFPAPLLPAAAGLLTGALALLYPEVLYQGFGNVNAVLAAGDDGGYGPSLLFQIAAAKVAATALCRGAEFFLCWVFLCPSLLSRRGKVFRRRDF